MPRCEDGSAFLDNEAGLTVDPDYIDDVLAELMFHESEGAPFNAAWNVFLDLDPEEMRRARLRQTIYLARYGRQSMVQWDDVRLVRFLELHAELSSFVGEENELSAKGETDS